MMSDSRSAGDQMLRLVPRRSLHQPKAEKGGSVPEDRTYNHGLILENVIWGMRQRPGGHPVGFGDEGRDVPQGERDAVR
jgi:hypothetical protein